MYVLIEHSGTPEHMEIMEKIAAVAESDYGLTCESVVGENNDSINLYNSELDKIATFENEPEEYQLYLCLKYFFDGEPD